MKAFTTAAVLAGLAFCAGGAAAQTPPQTSTKKVDGTDNVYIFRYGGHQSMFIVTPQGVIATDPISYLRPAKPYVDAIKAVTDKPIKYVIYSHQHYDHIAGGKPFKDLGATFIAHRRAKERFLELKKQNALLARRRDAGPGGRRQEEHHARRHDARAHLCRPQSFGQLAGDAPAEGEADLRRRLRADRERAVPQHPRQRVAARIHRLAEEAGWRSTGSA